jgi:hypothetical protein
MTGMHTALRLGGQMGVSQTFFGWASLAPPFSQSLLLSSWITGLSHCNWLKKPLTSSLCFGGLFCFSFFFFFDVVAYARQVFSQGLDFDVV